MKLRKNLALLLCAVLLAGLLVGCSKSSAMDSNGGAMMDMAPEVQATSAASDSYYRDEESGLTTTEKPSQSSLPQNQKLIVTMNLEAETEDMDALLAQIDQRVAELGGYMEKQNIYNGSSHYYGRNRYANLTIRVPVDQLDAFVEHVSGASNVVHYSENAKDITLSYVATQSRIIALETEQTRLLELLAKAENMSDLLQIEQRLTDVRTELEQVTSQLRLYDNLVDYGTIELSITEVQEYTPVEKETMWQRMGSGLKSSWQALGIFSENLLVFLVTALPWLIPISAIVILLIATGKKRRARRAERKAARKAKKTQQPEPPQES